MTAVHALDAAAALAEVGGKAFNLGLLVRAGFPVPPGVVLTTAAYRAYVAEHGLQSVITAALQNADAADPAALDRASATIRNSFDRARPAHLLPELERSLGPLLARPLAVRSSATAEDLPELSFAGQQDTFLNVRGTEGLLTAIVGCWSSLWTPRAIAYRLAHDLADADLALAVVIQELIPADVSGVLFTANPLTGRRHEFTVDAVPGLGEALVSGQVEPDHFVLDRTGRVLSSAPGAKASRTVTHDDGGVVTVAAVPSGEPCLSAAELCSLVALGEAIEEVYATPQDIEWAIDPDGAPWIVQSRAITSLFPVPQGAPEDSLWLSFGAMQGMLEPLTPLGQDVLQGLFVGLAQFFDLQTDGRSIDFLRPAGERLWIRIDWLLHSRFGRTLLPRMLTLIEPGAGAAMADLIRDAGPVDRGLSWSTVRRVSRLIRPILRRVPQLVIDAAGCRHRLERVAEDFVTLAATALDEPGRIADPRARLTARVAAVRRTVRAAFPVLLPAFAPIMAPSLFMLERLRGLARPLGMEDRALAVLRALDGNVTTQMNVTLWQVADAARADDASRDRLLAGDIDAIAEDWLRRRLPQPMQQALDDFMNRYGMRAVAEIDVGRPRWREEPAAVIRSVSAYLAGDGQDPATGLAEGRRAARASIDLLARRLGPVRGVQARFLARTVRGLLGARETPKFTLVRMFDRVREALLASARDLVAEGILDRPDDIAWFTLADLDHLDSRSPAQWHETVAERSRAYARELRRQVPRLLAGDGRAFFEGMSGDEGVLTGSPVSPGLVEGAVRVVFDPSTAVLRPGEILVCPGTDPAWTPLFLTAGGLVTEVGGLMTHGSVVAREHGIPAVVGVHQATSRLTTGQRIRLDGTTGRIQIIQDDEQRGSGDERGRGEQDQDRRAGGAS